MIKNIKQLLPGTFLKLSSDNQISFHNYWKPERQADQSISLEDAAEELEMLLSNVIKQMLITDVPIGLLQSSGIDSSLIAFLTQSNITSYTAQFDESSHDESCTAKKIASFTNHEWKPVYIEQANNIVDDFYKVAHHVDGQLADSSCLAHFCLSRAASKNITVAVAGDGADEIFAGYSTYKASRYASSVSPLIPKRFAGHLGNWLFKKYGYDERRVPWHEVLMRFSWGLALSKNSPHPQWRRLAFPWLLEQLYSPSMQKLLATNPLECYENAMINNSASIFDKCLLADQMIYLPGDMLTKVDRMSMAHGLEIRVPFLDRRIVHFASKLPEHVLSPLFGKSKLILRTILSNHSFPKEVTEGRKKGFNIPLANLLRNQLKPVGDNIIMKNADVFSPFINADNLRKIWNEHLDKKFNYAYPLWALLVFGAWRINQE